MTSRARVGAPSFLFYPAAAAAAAAAAAGEDDYPTPPSLPPSHPRGCRHPASGAWRVIHCGDEFAALSVNSRRAGRVLFACARRQPIKVPS